MKTRRRIRLKKGEEIQVNGFVIRATGLDDKRPESLCIYHPNVCIWPESRRDVRKDLYTGICDTVLCASTLTVGLVGDLAASATGYGKAVDTAVRHIADPQFPTV